MRMYVYVCPCMWVCVRVIVEVKRWIYNCEQTFKINEYKCLECTKFYRLYKTCIIIFKEKLMQNNLSYIKEDLYT